MFNILNGELTTTILHFYSKNAQKNSPKRLIEHSVVEVVWSVENKNSFYLKSFVLTSRSKVMRRSFQAIRDKIKIDLQTISSCCFYKVPAPNPKGRLWELFTPLVEVIVLKINQNLFLFNEKKKKLEKWTEKLLIL